MAALPELPRAIRTLTDAEDDRLQSRYPGLTPSPEKCPTCRGSKTFRWYAQGRGRDVVDYECPCIDQWVLERYLLHAGVGSAYQRIGWDDYVYSLPEPLMEYLADPEPYMQAGIGVILHGSMGNGKTTLGQLAVKRLLASGVDAYATSFNEMLDTFADGWRDKADREWFTRRVRNAQVLLIDDLFRERRGSSIAESAFEEVVRHRVAMALPLFITQNPAPEEIARSYNGNVMSLLTERSIMVGFEGSDYRPTARTRLLDEVRAGLTRPIVLA